MPGTIQTTCAHAQRSMTITTTSTRGSDDSFFPSTLLYSKPGTFNSSQLNLRCEDSLDHTDMQSVHLLQQLQTIEAAAAAGPIDRAD